MEPLSASLLLIDDDVDLIERLVDYYTPRGVKFQTFQNPEHALAELRSKVGEDVPYDIVLTDLRMDQLDGIEITKQIKSLHPDLPVIVMTGETSPDSAISAINVGATDYVLKPIHFPQLTVILQRTLHFLRLEKENRILKDRAKKKVLYQGIIAKSSSMIRAIDVAKRVSSSAATILLTGESGTGKEVMAHLIHRSSQRVDKPFVAVNCSAIPENLLESELFGHVKGSFTGADQTREGLFEAAEGGTLFLDEIGELPIQLQAKLLRVLQEKKIRRVGENTPRSVDVRVVAATLKNLEQEVREKKFREDLFYRLNVIPINLPSLRSRREDILPLAGHFLERFSVHYNKGIHGFSREALQWLLKHPWPGNVRELENLVERAVVLSSKNTIELEDLLLFDDILVTGAPPEFSASASIDASGLNSDRLPSGGRPAESDAELADAYASSTLKNGEVTEAESDTLLAQFERDQTTDEGTLKADVAKKLELPSDWSLEELERAYIQHVLEAANGVKDKAAKILGIDRKTLYRKLVRAERTTPEYV